MNLLAEIVGSRIRAEVFRLLFAGPDPELHVREIQRRTGFNDRAIRQVLAQLARLDLVSARRDGNRLYYRARQEHPLYPEIRGLALKTTGLAGVLREALDAEQIAAAFVFGSIARSAEKSASDVDLVVIGELGMRGVSRLLRGVNERIGREINPHVYTPDEYRRRVRSRDHFLTSVLKEPRIMVKGTENDLGRLAA